MIWQFIHILDILLWLFMAGSVFYVAFFAFASLFGRRAKMEDGKWKMEDEGRTGSDVRFLVLIPAYHEDMVIRNTVEAICRQDYPREQYSVAVISDNMQDETNEWLSSQPITLLKPQFEKSSKAKALQFAIENIEAIDNQPSIVGTNRFSHVVILDADNVVRTDFLSLLAQSCSHGYEAIQCHRCAKNSDNDVAVLDGVSEEINNTIFRSAHNIVGLSSALIGSGMCFTYNWFCSHVNRLSSAVEDRELETMLAIEQIYVKYEPSIPVFDEKVSNADNFQRQRMRWMTGQIQSLLLMLPWLPKAIATCNINYIDKTIQQALIPRSILIVMLAAISIFMTLTVTVWCAKWWILLVVIALSLLIATPKQLRRKALEGTSSLPQLVWRMLSNLLKMDRRNTDFIHTNHNSQ